MAVKRKRKGKKRNRPEVIDNLLRYFGVSAYLGCAAVLMSGQIGFSPGPSCELGARIEICIETLNFRHIDTFIFLSMMILCLVMSLFNSAKGIFLLIVINIIVSMFYNYASFIYFVAYLFMSLISLVYWDSVEE